MFTKVLNNLIGSGEKENEELHYIIFKMDVQDLRLYVNGKLKHKIDTYGLKEVVKKLTSINSETSKHFLEIDDMDSKKKKVFELILLVLMHKKVSIIAIEEVQIFLDTYDEILKKYDTDNKQIYESKIKDYIGFALQKISFETTIIGNIKITG